MAQTVKGVVARAKRAPVALVDVVESAFERMHRGQVLQSVAVFE